MRTNASSVLLSAFRGLRVSHATTAVRPTLASSITRIVSPSSTSSSIVSHVRLFSATATQAGSWLEPSIDRRKKMAKGRPRVATGGSTKGTTVIWGDYGLRMWDHHRRISAAQLKLAEDTIKRRLRGQKYRLLKRVACNVGVYVSGNEIRMGKGKGGFDHWACRMAVNQIAFEIKGRVHEQIIRDAFRLAGSKLPGQWEVVTKGEPPVIGITKLTNGLTLEDLKRPRKKLPEPEITPTPSSTETSSSAPTLS